MTKRDFITKYSENLGVTKDLATDCVNAFIDTLTFALASGESMQFKGFGTFEINERTTREGRNPKTGEKMMIAASKAVKFRPSRTLKEVINS